MNATYFRCMRPLLLLSAILLHTAVMPGLVSAVEPSRPGSLPAAVEQPRSEGPIDVVASSDGEELYVACSDGRKILVVDVAGQRVIRSIEMPSEPTGLALSGDGASLYVTCAAPEGTVAVVDVASAKIERSIPVGHWPTGPTISPDGRTLYVCNRFDNNVALVQLESGESVLVPTTREPFAAAVTPDGRSVFVVNHLPLDRGNAVDVAAVVTVIDTAANKTETIRLPIGSTCVRGICVSPDGSYAYVTHILSRYQMPTTMVERGWMNTNALSVIDVRKKQLLNTVLLDWIDQGAADPWGVAVTADGSTVCVTHAGSHEMSILDAEALVEKLLALPQERASGVSRVAADVPNDLSFLGDMRRRVPLGTVGSAVNGPRGLALVGSRAIVAARFTDNLATVKLRPELSGTVGTIPLGPKRAMSQERRGEMLFHDGTLCLQQWQSCASCHPDGRVNGLNHDLVVDGLGNPKNTRSMVLAHQTPPSMSLGVLADAEEAARSDFSRLLFGTDFEEQAEAIDAYLVSLKPVSSPYLVHGKLSPAAQRGKDLFFDGKLNCAKCHPEPLFTDLKKHDVGSRSRFDHNDDFDTPTLIECWRTAPYLHDGQYTTLNELFTKGQHGLKDDGIEPLAEEQIEDLVEYVRSL